MPTIHAYDPVEKIWHRDAYRTGIFFGFDEDLKQRAKQAGAIYSRTHRCWYLDYNAGNYRKCKELIPDHQIIRNGNDKTPAPLPGLQNNHNTAPIVVSPQIKIIWPG